MAIKKGPSAPKADNGGQQEPSGEQVIKRGPSTATRSGFTDLSMGDVFKPRLIISSAAKQKKGKTHFALTMPEPIAYFNFDQGLEGVGKKFIGQKDIKVSNYYINKPMKGDDQKVAKDKGGRIIDQFELDLDWAIANCRSLVLDTATELWSVLRVARFGKLGQVMPHHYSEVNAEFVNWIRQVSSSDASLNMIHRLKEEWTNDDSGKGKRTGKMQRDGYKGAEYDAHVSIVHDRDYAEGDTNPEIATGPFFFQVYDCRINSEIVGQMFIQGASPDCDFVSLAMACYPETKEGDWQ